MADIMDSLLGSVNLGNIQSGAMDVITWVLWGVLILGVGGFIWFKYQNKKIYKYPVRIFRQRSNGQTKELNTFGGYIKKGNANLFVIKQGRFKKKILDKLPSSDYMDEEDRLYYYQISPDSPLIQVKREFTIDPILVPNEHFIEPSQEEKNELLKQYILQMKRLPEYKQLSKEEIEDEAVQLLEKDIEETKNIQINATNVKYSPVPTDLKREGIQDIANLSNALGVDVNKQFAYFVIGVIALCIVGAVIFYIAINKGDIPIITK